ncbi:MAG: hypothetical protein KDD02_21320, partial [Phaeodactylibacter sp.]|nr:hypothetical protein [Phaeodactylibacter sp.]
MKRILIALIILTIGTGFSSFAQTSNTLSAKEIVQKADAKSRGDYSTGEITMTIVRPTWTREMTMKSWSRGADYALILVVAPARDKGT